MCQKNVKTFAHSFSNHFKMSNTEEQLKKIVLQKCELKKLLISDCKIISQRIFMQDKNYLSESTIKRIFGFMQAPPVFSPFVYDSLARFAGYESYKTFKALQQLQIDEQNEEVEI